MELSVKNLCNYVNSKIDINCLSKENYISTENMLPDKCGVVEASNLPSIKYANSFLIEDILISNIRPYFRKIWFAKGLGGCSQDVLVFRANKYADSKYLYYLLSQDAFFDYMMSTSKGTKMPRGDKKAIMDFPLKTFHSLSEQKAIADVLSALDDKIELNNRMNKNLEEQAQALFKHWFVDFEFPDENGNPYKSSGGKMKDSELGQIPEIFEIETIDEIASVSSGKRPLIKLDYSLDDCSYPIFGASGIMGFTNDFLFNERILIIGRVGTHGIVQKSYDKIWVSDNALVFKTDFFSFLYFVLINVDYSALNRGSTQPLITQTDMKNIHIMFNYDLNVEFERVVEDMFIMIKNNENQNQKLAELRDCLLPRLINGEINVNYGDNNA